MLAGIGHFAGWFDNVAHEVPHGGLLHLPKVPAPHVPQKLPHLPDIPAPHVPGAGPIITDTPKAAIEQGATTFKELRNGEAADKALEKAACAAMDQYFSQTPSYDETHKAIDRNLPSGSGPGTLPYRLLGPKVTKISNFVAVLSTQNVRVSYYYTRYCLK